MKSVAINSCKTKRIFFKGGFHKHDIIRKFRAELLLEPSLQVNVSMLKAK